MALASEVVVDYSLRLKRELSQSGDNETDESPADNGRDPAQSDVGSPNPAVWIAGYSNGYFGYIPSVRILNEGGYEAGPWDASIKERIVSTVHSLHQKLRQ